MIKSFRSKETEKIFNRQRSAKLPSQMHRTAYRKLWLLDRSIRLFDLLEPPSNRLELLRGKRKGQYSIRINRQWRIVFSWINDNAYDVEIVDYH